MVSNPWANFKNPRTNQVAEEYKKRSGGKTFDTNSGYSYDAILVVADVLERRASLDDADGSSRPSGRRASAAVSCSTRGRSSSTSWATTPTR
jgi:ABC-type branched-subunit amino acid transport system substrate-binding protein